MNNNSKQGVEGSSGSNAAQRQTSNLRQRWSWSEETIWTENMLMALENGVKGGKWFSLIDKSYRMKTLYKAWELVKRNKGAAGIDKISIERFTENLPIYLEEIQKELSEDRYKPNAVKRVYIPKGDGKKRPLGIPTVKDRIVQMAIKMTIEPIFEQKFLDSSYGFRPGKGAKDALREVDACLRKGLVHVVDADMQSYFDTIPHDKLMAKIENDISDSRILNLIKGWLTQDIMEGTDKWVPDRGSPQGAVISPLLANIYLHDLDVKMAENGFKMIRYADDFVVLCESKEKADEALGMIREWVHEQDLILHPEKTHIGNCLINGEGFDFLGYRFECGKRWIRQKSITKLRDAIRARTKRTCGKSLSFIIAKLNPVLKGWYNYFKHVDKWPLGTFDSFIRRRLRAILLKFEKRPGFGVTIESHKRWTNDFFEKQGLFSLQKAKELEIMHRSR